MTDPVGAVLGVAGLAGLFTTCVQGLNLIQLGRAFAQDYEFLQTKFEAQKVRFLIWGKVVGLVDGTRYDSRLDDPTIRPIVSKILNHIQDLFSNERNFSRKYGMRPDVGALATSSPVIFAETYRRFQSRLNRTQKQATLLTKSKWAIYDRQKFTILVNDFRDLMDSLDDITKSLQLLSRQEEFIKIEIESISDESSLRLLERSLHPEDQISSAASQRLRMLDRESEHRSLTQLTGLGSLSIRDSFRTAPTHITNEQNENAGAEADPVYPANIPQNQRILSQSLIRSRPKTQRASVNENWKSEDINLTNVGQALASAKRVDVLHTGKVIRLHDRSPNPNHRRMAMILSDILGSVNTPFVSLAPVGDDILQLLGQIEGPPLSPYQGGIFRVHIAIPEDFPWSPPKCRFLTKIYHPNIDARGKICLDILDPENWRLEMMHLETILISISALLDVPNIDDPLVPEIAAQYIQDRASFDAIARQYTDRFARGQQQVPVVYEAPRTLESNTRPEWQTRFLNDRLRWVRSCMTTLIEVLGHEPLDTANLDPKVPAQYLKHLYLLSAELTALDEKHSKFHQFTDSDYEKYENFFDVCSLEFRSLSTDDCWREAFPDLPIFHHNATRGTGSSSMGIFESHIPLPAETVFAASVSTSRAAKDHPPTRHASGGTQDESYEIFEDIPDGHDIELKASNLGISNQQFGGIFEPPAIRKGPEIREDTDPHIAKLQQLISHAEMMNW
ncbi:hypothetical protein CC78DRAFT_532918 [Lojkania enalia]|uniref:UBC core domain-containing protein n=1 Tax=Lojkania enalia TaxID=147567 RepID=A0A9P4N6J4_9PLEO|nr:hypothetical protein CC78DRAFT_532918 [Didymosphaeria enalia]